MSPEEFTTLINSISWTSVCARQESRMRQILDTLDMIIGGWYDTMHIQLHLVQATEPTAGDWETAYTDLDFVLPMPSDRVVMGLWETPDIDNKTSTPYLLINGAMVPVLATVWRGSSVLDTTVTSEYTNTTITLTTTEDDFLDHNVPTYLHKYPFIEAAFGVNSAETGSIVPVQYRFEDVSSGGTLFTEDAVNGTRGIITPVASASTVQPLRKLYFISNDRPSAAALVPMIVNRFKMWLRLESGTNTTSLAFIETPGILKREVGIAPYFFGEQSAYIVELIYVD